MEIKDLAGLSAPLEKLIVVCSAGLGKITEPMLIRKKADAKAYEIKIITNALLESKEKLSSNTEYKDGNIQIIPTLETSKDINFLQNKKLLEEATLIQNDMKDRILYQQLKKEKNIYNTLNFTMNELENETKVSEEKVNEDWITRFFNTIEDINNEQLQQLWAKILAGEIKQPNSYSLRTLELLKNLSFKEAELFSKIGNLSIQNQSKTSYFIPSNKELLKKFDINFSDIVLLKDLDLIHSNELSFDIEKAVIDSSAYLFYGKELIKLDLKKDTKINLRIYSFTSIGKELLNLVERTSNNLYREELSKEFKLFSSQTKLYYTPLLNDESAFIPSSFIEIP